MPFLGKHNTQNSQTQNLTINALTIWRIVIIHNAAGEKTSSSVKKKTSCYLKLNLESQNVGVKYVGVNIMRVWNLRKNNLMNKC